MVCTVEVGGDEGRKRVVSRVRVDGEGVFLESVRDGICTCVS